MGVRSTAKAIIIDNGKILLNKCSDRFNGVYYTLPGGGQNQYETLPEAIMRECLEETGYNVIPVRFAALFEEICDDPDFRASRPVYAHKMLHIFVCGLKNRNADIPTETDVMQTGCEWVPFTDSGKIRLLPEAVGVNIQKIVESDFPLYLGSAHIPHNHG